jgi:hypothetical protein
MRVFDGMRSTIGVVLLGAATLWAAAAMAQSSPTMVTPGDGTGSLGSGKATAKLLTRDELRACLATQAKQKKEREALVQREKALDGEKPEIVAEGDAIKAARETLDRTSEDAIKAFNQRVLDHDARVNDHNKRNRALITDATAWQAASDQWKTQCGDRRYREDDEIAIKRGK